MIMILNGNGKAVPLKAWSGPEGSRKLMFPDFMTTAQDGDEVVCLTHRPPLPPGNNLVLIYVGARGGVVVKALRYKPAGRGFDSRLCNWNFSVT